MVINGDDSGTDGESVILFMSAKQGTNRGTFIAAERQASSNAHDLIFATSEGSAEPTEAMRIADDGKVGIGEVSPDDKLHIKEGNVRIETATNQSQHISFFEVDQERARIEFDSSTNNDLSIKTFDIDSSQLDRITIKTTQAETQVGIGIATPTSALQVEGVISASGGSSSSGDLRVVGDSSLTTVPVSYTHLRAHET